MFQKNFRRTITHGDFSSLDAQSPHRGADGSAPEHKSPYKSLKNNIRTQSDSKSRVQFNSKMKLFNFLFLLFPVNDAFGIPAVGQNRYVNVRQFSYLNLMQSLNASSRQAILQKINNPKAAKFRVQLAKAMKAQMEAARQAPKRLQDKHPERLTTIQSRSRMNRFRNFHN